MKETFGDWMETEEGSAIMMRTFIGLLTMAAIFMLTAAYLIGRLS